MATIEQNKERFINILRSIKRSGADIEGLIEKLEKSDFFTAPASSKFHANYEGGLCQHSLNVFDNLMMLCLNLTSDKGKVKPFDEDTIKIVALLHDVSKMNFYETYVQNKKVYSANGSKYDEMGKYDWQAVKAYRVIDAEDRFLYGNHEQTADFIASYYIPLTVEEHVAILNHMGGKGVDSAQTDLTPIYNRYPLAILLHSADALATFIDERIVNE